MLITFLMTTESNEIKHKIMDKSHGLLQQVSLF